MKDILQLEGADDYVTDPSKLVGISGALMTVVKDCADKLEKHYPGWMWAVQRPLPQAGDPSRRRDTGTLRPATRALQARAGARQDA